jgi:Recombinase
MKSSWMTPARRNPQRRCRAAHQTLLDRRPADGYRLRQILDPIERDPFGQPKRIGSQLELHPEQAEIVLEMFERYADGEPPRGIAADLNARGIPSPGSSWRRRVRRCHGWMGSAIRQARRASSPWKQRKTCQVHPTNCLKPRPELKNSQK